VLHNFTQDARKELHSEIFRVLKTGGVFVNGDKYAEEDPLLHKESYETVLGMMRGTFKKEGKYELCKEWDEHMEEDERPERKMFELSSISQLRELGFREVENVWRYLTDAVIIATK
jgi:tRNA (cmo5U34)-methyltransferase